MSARPEAQTDSPAGDELLEALRASEERFQLAADAVHGHIYDVDVRTRAVWRSEGLLELVGYRPRDVPAHAGWWMDAIHPDDREAASAAGRERMAAGADVYSTRYRVRHRDGRYVHVWDRVRVVRDGTGQVVRLVGSVTDVTREHEAFAALDESQCALRAAEERSRLALDAARLGTFDYDVVSGRLDWDARTRELLGVDAEFVPTYQAFIEAVAPEHRAGIESLLARVLSAGETRYEIEYRAIGLRTGEERWIRAHGRVTSTDRDGVRVVGTVQDVTEFREAERRFRAFADSMPQLAWVAAADGSNLYANRRWYEYTGAAPETSYGDVWRAALHPEDEPRLRAAWDRARQRVEPYECEYRLRRHDGAWRWFLARGVPQRDGQGRLSQWFGTCTDVDDAKRLEQSLREADRRKDEFLATLAHELRNPLAPIRSAARILESPHLGERELAWSREVVKRQVQHMALLLDDLLDVSRITRGELVLRRERVDLAAVVDAAVETARPSIDARHHALHVELPVEPPALEADPVRLAQVLANLLTNAAKYTDPGGRIELRATVGRDALAITVRDDGIGLAPAQLAQVFEMFSQVKAAIDRSEGGLGIGLALVRGLVELHGGRVEARSDGLGRGSEFVVHLPLSVPGSEDATDRADPAPSTPCATRPCRVLVADDNRDAAESLAMLLGLSGHEVRVAHDGRAALEIARDFAPDFALLDIGMPELNGYETAARLRAQPWGRSIVLIAVTGWGQDDDKRRATDAGFDHHLTKPVDPDRVEALLAARHTA